MPEDNTGITADDWGAAMAEQESAETTTEDDWGAAMAEQESAETTTENDWGAAMAEQSTSEAKSDAKPHVFEQLSAPSTTAGDTPHDLEMIMDIPVQLSVELGRTKLPIKDLLQLSQGSIVELTTLAGEPMDIMINGLLIARGEVVLVNEKLGIRVTDIITPSERLRRISR